MLWEGHKKGMATQQHFPKKSLPALTLLQLCSEQPGQMLLPSYSQTPHLTLPTALPSLLLGLQTGQGFSLFIGTWKGFPKDKETTTAPFALVMP